jgi:hypothetical protein
MAVFAKYIYFIFAEQYGISLNQDLFLKKDYELEAQIKKKFPKLLSITPEEIHQYQYEYQKKLITDWNRQYTYLDNLDNFDQFLTTALSICIYVSGSLESRAIIAFIISMKIANPQFNIHRFIQEKVHCESTIYRHIYRLQSNPSIIKLFPPKSFKPK